MNLREMMQKRSGKDTLCWYCKNASSTREHFCVWANCYEPVKGWKAEKTEIESHKYFIGSYKVIECPNYIKLR